MSRYLEFTQLRKKYIEKRFSKLNPEQRSAALSCDGAFLILAGAGSGKTTVIVNRIMNMLQFGNAYESDYVCYEPDQEDIDTLKRLIKEGGEPDERMARMLKAGNIRPWNIMAITFTNKAAAELKDRITKAVGDDGRDVFASTFHSACVRFLRRDAERLGWPKDFSIYDTDDSEKVLKDIYKALSIDDKIYPLKWMLSRFGHIKDNLLTIEEYKNSSISDPRVATTCRVYEEYQKRLRKAGAFDFDDLIYYTVRLLEENEDIRDYYHARYRYIMVDEYQDTSHAQFMLIKLLTNSDNNVFVVGDDDQSIYSFRGAVVENILNFDKIFSPVKVVRLEQNYRSTSNILGCANSVIAKNNMRKGKNLWTAGEVGEKVVVHTADNAGDEAAYIAESITRHYKEGIPLSAHAILYRTNAQSNAIEQYFSRRAINHRIFGGLRFYDRAEIKDVLAYLELIVHPNDNLRLKRIINRPARKIGPTTVDRIEQLAAENGTSMMYVIMHCDSFGELSRAASSLKGFYELMRGLSELYSQMTLGDFVDKLIDMVGYRIMLSMDKEEGEKKLENVNELVSNVRNFEVENPEGDLALFLENVALVSALDDMNEDNDYVSLMTLHTAKGLEFDYVYIVGMEEGLFPMDRAKYNETEIEEERRLAYVGMTRARKQLFLLNAEERMIYGSTRRNPESRFITEISDEFKVVTGNYRKKSSSYLDREYGRAGSFASSYGSSGQGYSRGGASSSGVKTYGTSKPQTPAAAPKKSFVPTKTTFAAGDIVEHKMFGRGKVLSATPIGGDVLLEIEFDRAGKKKTMANYTPMTKVEE